jgi:hypothetical protein
METEDRPKPAEPVLADMAPLIARVRSIVEEQGSLSAVREAPHSATDLARRFGFVAEGRGKPEVILSEDVFVELGHPSEASLSMILTTFDASLVADGRVTMVGPDISAMKEGHRSSFAQVVIAAVDPEDLPDPFSLENTQYLMHRLPGYMVRSVPGRLWVRVSKKGRAAGLDLFAVGSALNAAFKKDFSGVRKAETIFVTACREDVEAFSPVSVEAKIFSGLHKKLVLGLDGSVECTELNCETCEEKPVCDTLRDVVIARRKMRDER